MRRKKIVSMLLVATMAATMFAGQNVVFDVDVVGGCNIKKFSGYITVLSVCCASLIEPAYYFFNGIIAYSRFMMNKRFKSAS